MAPDFIHLRVHSAYSLLEGAIKTDQLIELCQTHNMPAVAVTDTNNMFGALEHSVELAQSGIQPIVGCSLVVVEKAVAATSKGHDKLPGATIFLVQNETGYQNLIGLVSRAYMSTDGPTEPHIMLDDLNGASDGLIVLTGGPDAPIGQYIQNGHIDDAEALTKRMADLFDGRLYIEIMRHNQASEVATEEQFLDLAYKYDLPLVATNDVYFGHPDMYEAHDALLCIAGGNYVGQEDRRHVTRDHYFKNAEEMRVQFADLPEALDNTVVIAQRCAFKVPLRDPILPQFGQGGDDEAEALRLQARAGLEERLKTAVFTENMGEKEREKVAIPYRERLETELDIIITMDFPGYFLIVSDFVKWAKDNDVPVGPGRGSGTGSAVAWSLRITDMDPLRFGLLFERLLNPERVSMPDFDIDFCQEKRGRVIRYVQEKYGADQVAQIITFGKLQARAVLRDVGRVLEMPYGQVDRLCKMVPNNPAKPTTLAEAIDSEPRLQAERDSDETVAHLLDTALKLEGLYRHASTHAAGLVLGDRPLDQLVPIYRDPRSSMPVTQFNMKWVELAGLVKFDFLGLKTLTVIDRTVGLLRDRGINVEISSLPLDDKLTYDMLARGDSVGVFQFEGAGMRDALRKLRPDQFEDLIALGALYRPGPMDNIPTYIKRKHGEEKPDYMHELLQPVLEETFGVIIYQEQVMQIAQILSGYSLGEADLLRRAMGKKIQSEMDAQRVRFVEGAVVNGVEPERASFIFDLVDKFAGYGFNKSHSTGYAMVSYQTAWLKANYPVEFMAASMTLDMGNTDKLNAFRRELVRLKIDLMPPDINQSETDFTVEVGKDGELCIRYALAAIKNVGAQAMRTMMAERDAAGPYANLLDFAQRIDPHQVNKRQLENLVKAGAFDSLNGNRAQTFGAIETLLRHANVAANDRDSSQESLFGDAGDAEDQSVLQLPDIRDWGRMEKLQSEFDAVGFYLTAHPLDASKKALAQQNVLTWGDARIRLAQGATGFKLAGTISKVQERKSQRGKAYAFVELSDTSGSFEVIFFSELLGASRDILQVNESIVMAIEARLEDDTPKLVAQTCRTLKSVTENASAGVRLFLDRQEPLAEIRNLLEQGVAGNGYVHLVLDLDDQQRSVELTLDRRYAITPDITDSLGTVPGVVEVHEI